MLFSKYLTTFCRNTNSLKPLCLALPVLLEMLPTRAWFLQASKGLNVVVLGSGTGDLCVLYGEGWHPHLRRFEGLWVL